jgi:hypothetical protein
MAPAAAPPTLTHARKKERQVLCDPAVPSGRLARQTKPAAGPTSVAGKGTPGTLGTRQGGHRSATPLRQHKPEARGRLVWPHGSNIGPKPVADFGATHMPSRCSCGWHMPATTLRSTSALPREARTDETRHSSRSGGATVLEAHQRAGTGTCHDCRGRCFSGAAAAPSTVVVQQPLIYSTVKAHLLSGQRGPSLRLKAAVVRKLVSSLRRRPAKVPVPQVGFRGLGGRWASMSVEG